MIPNCSLTSGSDYVELMWNSPQYPPSTYKVTYLCIINCTWMPNRGIDRIVNLTTSNLTSEDTSIRVRKLNSKSICTLKLVAVYNPASTDSGIAIIYKTPTGNTSKFTFGREFHKNCMGIQL